MADVDVRLNPAAIAALGSEPGMRREIDRAADGMAGLAAAGAPKDTGRAAASIEGRPSTEDADAYDVSWDSSGYYLIFHEGGTAYVPAQHFLRHAFETYIHV